MKLLLRAATLTYAAMVSAGTLMPLSGWRALGVSPLAYLTAPLPTHITGFDLALNMLGYLPLGALLVLTLHPRARGAAAVALATGACMILSGVLEALQTYLPLRIASNVDLASNTLGAFAGALPAAWLAPRLLDSERLDQLRRTWLQPRVALALLMICLWPLAQLAPTETLFGHGQLVPDAWRHLLDRGDVLPAFDAEIHVAAETVITATCLAGVGLALFAALHARAPRAVLMLALGGLAVLIKTLAYGQQFGAERAFVWLTPGAVGGLMIGTLLLTVALPAPATSSRRLAMLCLVLLLAVVNVLAPNPYYAQFMAEWRPGRMRDLIELVGALSALWPLAMLAAVLIERPAPGRADGGRP